MYLLYNLFYYILHIKTKILNYVNFIYIHYYLFYIIDLNDKLLIFMLLYSYLAIVSLLYHNFFGFSNPFTMASSNSGGVKVMNIGGRVMNERERLIGMLDEERAWRARFLKSQHLAPDEPLMSKEYYKHYYNPFRRFYRIPLNAFERLLTPVMVREQNFHIEHNNFK